MQIAGLVKMGQSTFTCRTPSLPLRSWAPCLRCGSSSHFFLRS